MSPGGKSENRQGGDYCVGEDSRPLRGVVSAPEVARWEAFRVLTVSIADYI